MPQIIINEQDLSTVNTGEYLNYSVVIPGYRASKSEGGLTNESVANKSGGGLTNESVAKMFDENGVMEITSVSDFEQIIGKVAPQELTLTEKVIDGEPKDPETIIIPAHYGNQMAYELLKSGYTVLYLDLGVYSPSSEPSFEDAANLKAPLNKLKDAAFWEPLKDKATYDFRFICSGLMTDPNYGTGNAGASSTSLVNDAAKEISKLAASRGDAIALIDIDEQAIEVEKQSVNTVAQKGATTISNQATLIKAIQEAVADISLAEGTVDNGNYAAIFTPNVCYTNVTDTDYKNNKFPASFHYLVCFAQYVLTGNFAEWYAMAGKTRGYCNYNIDSTVYKLGDIAVNALEPRTNKDISKAVNVISKIGNNYYIWGNRTAAILNDTDLKWSHFLNIRQLCSTIKKQVYTACRQFTFDPNSDTLWINFCNAIKPMLEGMKADQGIADYIILKVTTTQKAKLKARIRIIPIEAVEDFDITITLEDSFGDINITIEG